MSDSSNIEKEIDLSLRSIKSIFETGEVKKMYDIAPLFPTKITRALGINHGRYVDKLSKPEKFTIDEIVRFSRLTGVNLQKVMDVILKEASANIAARENSKLVKGKKNTVKKSNSSAKLKASK